MKRIYTPTPLNRLGQKISRISWPAIFAGGLTALVIVFMLNLLGLGIGLSTIDPLTESDPLNGLGTGTLIWLGLSNLAALFVGGIVAGRMSGYPSKTDGGLHGFLSWALFTLVSLFLITSTIGSMISGLSGAVSGLFGGDGSKDITVMVDKAKKDGLKLTDLSLNNIKKEAFKLINEAEDSNLISDSTSRKAKGAINNSNAEQAITKLKPEDLDRFVNQPDIDIKENGKLEISTEGNGDFLKKDELKKYLSENTQMGKAEINTKVDGWEQKIEVTVAKAEKTYAEARKKLIEYSDKAAEALATISIIAFFMFFLGAIAAFFGGITGSPILTVDEELIEDRRDIA